MALHCFSIYQIKDPNNCSYAFRDWDIAMQRKFSFKDYKNVFYDCLESNATDAIRFLDELFIIFNSSTEFEKCNFEDTFYGHSLSVGDIIRVETKYYYINPVGFEDITYAVNLTK